MSLFYSFFVSGIIFRVWIAWLCLSPPTRVPTSQKALSPSAHVVCLCVVCASFFFVRMY